MSDADGHNDEKYTLNITTQINTARTSKEIIENSGGLKKLMNPANDWKNNIHFIIRYEMNLD